MSYLEYSGKKTWYEVVNPDNLTSAPLIILHGGPGYPSYYLNGCRKLSSYFPVVLYDQQGCGRSSKIETKKACVKFYVEELEALRKEINAPKINILGHSWGAALALEYCRKYKKNIEKIILASPYIDTKRWNEDAVKNINKLEKTDKDNLMLVYNKAKEELSFKYKLKRFFRLKEKTQDNSFSDEVYKSIEKYNETFLKSKRNDNEVYLNNLNAMQSCSDDIYIYMWGRTEFLLTGTLRKHKSSDVLKNLNIPCLFLAGDNDEVSSDSLLYYNNLTKRHDNKIIIYKNSNHSANVDNEEKMNLDVSEFILGK